MSDALVHIQQSVALNNASILFHYSPDRTFYSCRGEGVFQFLQQSGNNAIQPWKILWWRLPDKQGQQRSIYSLLVSYPRPTSLVSTTLQFHITVVLVYTSRSLDPDTSRGDVLLDGLRSSLLITSLIQPLMCAVLQVISLAVTLPVILSMD